MEFFHGDEPSSGEAILTQQITLEPLETDTLFAMPRWTKLSGAFGRILTDDTGGIYLPSIPYSRVEYTVWSAVTPFKEEADANMPRYLALASRHGTRLKTRRRDNAKLEGRLGEGERRGGVS